MSERGLTDQSFGSHSIRKGSAQTAAGSNPDSADGAAVSKRMGHTLGIEDRYFLTLDGKDQYIGRIAAGLILLGAFSCRNFLVSSGLPVGTLLFGFLPPFFHGMESSLVVREALSALFPNLPATLTRVMTFALASLVHHFKAIDAKIDSKHPLRSTLFWRDRKYYNQLAPLVNFLLNFVKSNFSRKVVCRAHKVGDPIAVTGVPAVVHLMGEVKQLSDVVATVAPALQNLVPQVVAGVSKVLEDNCVEANTLTKTGFEEMMARTMNEQIVPAFERAIAAASQSSAQAASTSVAPARPTVTLHYYNGKYWKVPETYGLPKGGPGNLFQVWCLGDDSEAVPPLRNVDNRDVPARLHKRLTDVRYLMRKLEDKLRKDEQWIENPTIVQVNDMFSHAEDAIRLGATDGNHQRRHGQLEWTTLVKENRKLAKKKKSPVAAEEEAEELSDE